MSLMGPVQPRAGTCCPKPIQEEPRMFPTGPGDPVTQSPLAAGEFLLPGPGAKFLMNYNVTNNGNESENSLKTLEANVEA